MPGRENCYDSPRCFDRKIGHFYPSFCRCCHTYSPSTHVHTYIHTYILQSTYMVFTFTRLHSVAAVRRRRQLLKRKGESKISECVCAQCYLLDSYVYVCPHAIFYALLKFFCQTFIGIFYCRQYIIYGKIDCSVSCSKNQRLFSYIALKDFELSCDFDFVQT